MKILVTGATGFIGRAAVTLLQGRGYQIVAWVRSEDRARDMLGYGPELIGPDMERDLLRDKLEECDAVLNLSGRPIPLGRWTHGQKQELWDSRVGLTRILSEEINRCQSPPSVFVSSSAVGYYGNRPQDILNEESPKGDGYLSDLCVNWENAAVSAGSESTRVCILRMGVVLGREGGILKLLTPFFRYGFGNVLGDGRQNMPWIHLIDALRVMVRCIEDPDLRGVFNCSSPDPCTAMEFSQTLRNKTRARILIGVPSWVLRVVLGENAKHYLSSQYVVPEALMAKGFKFYFTNISMALDYELDHQEIFIRKVAVDEPLSMGDKFESATPVYGQYKLTTETHVEADEETVFDFFSSPLNLGLTTPPGMGFKIQNMPDNIQVGSNITYKIKLWGITLTWVTEIVTWAPPAFFVDRQVKGPYRLWRHEHRIFRSEDNMRTVMTDAVIYRVPLGIIGRLLHRFFIADQLKRIFKFRKQVILLRFGGIGN